MPGKAREIRVPRPDPDEWLIGLQGRIRVLNGIRPIQHALTTALRAEANRRNLLDGGVFELMSQILGSPLDDLVRRHTAVPYRSLFGRKNLQDWKLSPDLRAVISTPVVKHHRFCPRCASREGAKTYSVWHLHHQYAGVMCCWDCGGDLVGVSNLAPFTLPHLIEGTDALHVYVSDHLDREAMQRHKDLTLALLARESLPTLDTLIPRLRQRAQQLGVLARTAEYAQRLRQQCWPYLQLFGYETESILVNTLRGEEGATWGGLILLLGLSETTDDALSLIGEPVSTPARTG